MTVVSVVNLSNKPRQYSFSDKKKKKLAIRAFYALVFNNY